MECYEILNSHFALDPQVFVLMTSHFVSYIMREVMRKSHLNVVIVSVHSGVRPYEINVMYVVVFECENIFNTLLRHKIVRASFF